MGRGSCGRGFPLFLVVSVLFVVAGVWGGAPDGVYVVDAGAGGSSIVVYGASVYGVDSNIVSILASVCGGAPHCMVVYRGDSGFVRVGGWLDVFYEIVRPSLEAYMVVLLGVVASLACRSMLPLAVVSVSYIVFSLVLLALMMLPYMLHA